MLVTFLVPTYLNRHIYLRLGSRQLATYLSQADILRSRESFERKHCDAGQTDIPRSKEPFERKHCDTGQTDISRSKEPFERKNCDAWEVHQAHGRWPHKHLTRGRRRHGRWVLHIPFVKRDYTIDGPRIKMLWIACRIIIMYCNISRYILSF
jgi:hypothetical protein